VTLAAGRKGKEAMMGGEVRVRAVRGRCALHVTLTLSLPGGPFLRRALPKGKRRKENQGRRGESLSPIFFFCLWLYSYAKHKYIGYDYQRST